MFQKIVLGMIVSFGISAFADHHEHETKTEKTTTTTTKTKTTAASADQQVFKVEGMHCGGCAGTVEKAVCKKDAYAKCSAAVVDEKTEMGEVRITPKKGQAVDVEALRTALKDVGYTLKN